MIEEDLVTCLKANVSSIEGRVDPLVLKQGSDLPALTYQLIDTVRRMRHDGPSGPTAPRFQINCFAETYAQSKQVAAEVRFALHGFRGQMGETFVTKSKVEDQGDDYQPDTKRYRQIVDAIIKHREEVA